MRPSVLSCGDFGRSMAAELPEWRHVAIDEQAHPTGFQKRLEATVAEASVILFATWREQQDISRMLDTLCQAAATPWMSVVGEHPWVRVGPGIVPGRTACYACFDLRRLQHDQNADLSLALQAAYGADPTEGVRGYLPHHITVAAGLAAWVNGMLRSGNDGRSPVARYHTLRHEIELDNVVGIHGCRVCDRRSAARGNDVILACINPRTKRPGHDGA